MASQSLSIGSFCMKLRALLYESIGMAVMASFGAEMAVMASFNAENNKN